MRQLFPSRRITHHRRALWYISGHDGTRSYYYIVGDRHAQKDDCAASNPNVFANRDWPSELHSSSSHDRISWMVCSVNLNSRTNLCPCTYSYRHHI
jgi:hypothetical protein